MTACKVAIVGAGLAGLTCGSILAKNGLNVTVFDKGRFPGGRLASRDHDANTFDYGAQYFTPRDLRFQQFLVPFERKGKVMQWKGKFAMMINGDLKEEELIEPRYVGVPMMRTVAEELASGLECYTSHRITSASRQGTKWSLTGSIENEELHRSFAYGDYDFLVFNLPPQQAADIHPHALLSEVKLLPCWALLLTFQERIQLDCDGVKLDDKVISWVARDSSKPGRNLGERWVIHASSQWSDEYFSADSSEVEKILKVRFATLFGIKLPAINFTKLHRWKFALPIFPPDWGCIVDQSSAIGYCGDWCVAARVEGAFLSGLTLAEEILRSQLQ
jgi:predicted NAD/FAD-dependent oxidoreductase